MSGDGTRTYSHPRILWGGANEERLKLSKGAKGGLNCYPGLNAHL